MKSLFIASMLLIIISGKGYSQGCSVCAKTTAGMDSRKAKGLNGGIIYLGIVPLAIMGTLGVVWWKSNKQMNNS